MKKGSRNLPATANADRFRAPSKNETLPQSDFVMLIESIGEPEHELLTKLAKRIETMITANRGRKGGCATFQRIDLSFGFFCLSRPGNPCRTVMNSRAFQLMVINQR
jgi:hypothetical protein